MKAKLIALLVGLLILAGCVSAGIGIGGHGVGATVTPLSAGIYAD
jgi:hypothetical protein